MNVLMRRTAGGLAVLALVLAACTQTDDGGDAGDVLGGTPDLAPTMGTEETMAASPAGTDDSGASPAASPGDAGATASPGSGGGTMPLGELVEDADEWLGEEVEVVGSVEEQLSEDAITLTAVGGVDVAESVGAILVVRGSDADDDFEVEVGQIAEVEGVFAEFTDEGLEEAGSDLTTDDEALSGYDGDYVIVAEEVDDFGSDDDSDDS